MGNKRSDQDREQKTNNSKGEKREEIISSKCESTKQDKEVGKKTTGKETRKEEETEEGPKKMMRRERMLEQEKIQ
ncbi:hypothetical protein CCP4SC76_6910002 [Gammaproteobacteria bacterium]